MSRPRYLTGARREDGAPSVHTSTAHADAMLDLLDEDMRAVSLAVWTSIRDRVLADVRRGSGDQWAALAKGRTYVADDVARQLAPLFDALGREGADVEGVLTTWLALSDIERIWLYRKARASRSWVGLLALVSA